ncbi:MAG: hypothetical protein HYX32_01210 [Actinobacteria bacterium]|nr:hypothetical protein [Actinomycetota bacterium]
MHARNPVRAAALAAVAPSIVVGIGGPARAAEQPNPQKAATSPGRYCTTRLLSPAELDQGVKSVVNCSESFTDAMARAGVRMDPNSTPDAVFVDGVQTRDASGWVAVHYDPYGGSAQGLYVLGTTCEGGGISFNAGDYWNDKISSTRHQSCGTIKHWDANNYTGPAEITTGGSGNLSNLGPMSDRVSSIRYYTPAQ